MTFEVKASPGDGVVRSYTIISPRPGAQELPELDHVVQFTGDVQVGWAPWTPYGWRIIEVAEDVDALEPVLRSLAGETAAAELRSAVRLLAHTEAQTTKVSGAAEPGGLPGDRSPWLRWAAVESFDRWLDLPLIQALVDAERAAAQAEAADSLSRESRNRGVLIDQALRSARQAAIGLTSYIDGLTQAARRPPARLMEALRQLVGSFAVLAKEADELDPVLASVQEAWYQLSDVSADGPALSAHPRRDFPRPTEPPVEGRSLVDPRWVPARVLDLSGPRAGEVDITHEQIDGTISRVTVRVPATVPRQLRARLDDVLSVRLRSLVSGKALAFGLLTRESSTSGGREFFRGTMTVTGESAALLRADVYDGVDPPPIEDDEGPLFRVRRAVFFLAAWRKLVADLQIGTLTFSPTKRLAGIVSALLAGEGDQLGPEGALWAGGPSEAQLLELVRLGDERLRALLEDDGEALELAGISEPAKAILRSTSGPGSLLVAEWAAAG